MEMVYPDDRADVLAKHNKPVVLTFDDGPHPKHTDEILAILKKYGVKAVFFGRMIPLFRSFISVPAGIERMPLTTFLVFTALGSLICGLEPGMGPR